LNSNGAAIAPQKQWYQFRLYAVTTLFSSSTNRKNCPSLFLSKNFKRAFKRLLFRHQKILKTFGSWNDLIGRNKLCQQFGDTCEPNPPPNITLKPLHRLQF
jgi:hypothetical protein